MSSPGPRVSTVVFETTTTSGAVSYILVVSTYRSNDRDRANNIDRMSDATPARPSRRRDTDSDDISMRSTSSRSSHSSSSSSSSSYGSDRRQTDSTVIRVTNLSKNIVQAHLIDIFSHYGVVAHVDLPMHPHFQCQNRGVGYVRFGEPVSAMRAAVGMHGGCVDGCVIDVVVVSEQRRPRRSRSRTNSSSDGRR